MKSLLRPALGLTIFFLVVTGFAFPLAIYGLAQGIFPHQANGSMIVQDGKVIGSELIGQNFTDPKYFHPRPSAAGSGYDGANSSGTNLGPTSDKLINGLKDGSFLGVKQLAEQYRKENNLAADAVIPVDAVTRSGSGLDPHISVQNARMQVERIAKARRLPPDQIGTLIDQASTPRFMGVYGDVAVDVLRLNLLLDQLTKAK